LDNLGKAKALGAARMGDQAVARLADLGLLVSTPESIPTHRASPQQIITELEVYGEMSSCFSPSKAIMDQSRILGTTPSCSHHGTVSTYMVTEASSRQHPFLGGYESPHCVQQPAFATQLVPVMSGFASNPLPQGVTVPSPCNPMSRSQVPNEHGALAASTHQCDCGSPSADVLRSWLQAGMPSGLDLTAELQAAAPEVYED